MIRDGIPGESSEHPRELTRSAVVAYQRAGGRWRRRGMTGKLT